MFTIVAEPRAEMPVALVPVTERLPLLVISSPSVLDTPKAPAPVTVVCPLFTKVSKPVPLTAPNVAPLTMMLPSFWTVERLPTEIAVAPAEILPRLLTTDFPARLIAKFGIAMLVEAPT